MPDQPDLPQRRFIRLPGYDYTRPGAYFVTLVARKRVDLFGTIVNGEMVLNLIGRCVDALWQAQVRHFPLSLGAWVVMPDHLHGIITLQVPSGERAEASGGGIGNPGPEIPPDASPQLLQPHGTVSGSLNALVQNFKSVSTRRINSLRSTPAAIVWQRNFFEHIIRSEAEWEKIDAYIRANPAQWDGNRFIPHRIEKPWIDNLPG
jgi:putative transposase